MNTLVTGSTGFVGGHLVDRLMARGDTVTALVRTPSRAAGLAARGIRLVKGDLADMNALTDAAAGCDVVYHVAALTGAVDEAEFLGANRDGTASVQRAVEAVGTSARIVLVSSMAAGGPARRDEPKRGAGGDAPVTMYGRSKLAAERVLRDGRVAHVIVRPPTVYGPRDRDNLLAIFKAAKLGVAPIFGDGTMQVSLIHVEDLADALVQAGTTADIEGNNYYVNHPEVLTTADLVREIGRQVGRAPTLIPIPRWLAHTALSATGGLAALLGRKTILRADKTNEFFQEAWTADPGDFIADTGWLPRFNAADGLAHTADWYRREGWL
ncbi:MAG: NAD-dependent epimerase/dehydratase family protein [Gemmatimonadales bacterium]